jgi:phosphopantetheinyl transferase (holo-ACP synthase)
VTVALRDQAAVVASRAGIRRWHLSLSHNEHDAVAFAVAEA